MDDSFQRILEGLENGEDEASAEVVYRFADRLIRVARSRLTPQVRKQVDAEDVTQSVFRSFFRRKREGEFEFANWDSMWGLLVVMTMRKCGRNVASLHAACRDVRREVSPQSSADSEGNPFDSPARDPRPEEVVALTEMLELLMSELKPEQQEILTLRLQSYSIEEIADQVKRTERTVHRVLADIRRKLTRKSW